MLPQRNPKEYYRRLMYSYNTPDFTSKMVNIDKDAAYREIESDKRTETKIKNYLQSLEKRSEYLYYCKSVPLHEEMRDKDFRTTYGGDLWGTRSQLGEQQELFRQLSLMVEQRALDDACQPP